MAEQTLKFIIDAENRADKTFKDVKKGIDGIQGKIKDMQPAFKAMAAVGVAGFAAVSGAIITSLQAADEATKVQAQLGAVLQSTGRIAGVTAEMAIGLSKALQRQTTFSDEAILSAENLLLTFTGISKDVFPEALQAVLNMSVALGQDLKSSSIQLGKALQDPILGISALRKVGVNFSEANKEMIKGMVEAGNTMGAQQFILKELATEFGGAAQAQAGTFGGKIEQVKNQVNELQESIGMALIPTIEKIVTKLAPVVEKITIWVEKNPQLTITLLVATAAMTGFLAIVGLLGMALTPLIAVIGAITLPIALVIIAITLLIGATILWIAKWQEMINAALWLWEGFVYAIQPLIEWFKTLLYEIVWVWNDILMRVKDVLIKINETIKTWIVVADFLIQKGWIAIKEFFQNLWNDIVRIFTDAYDKIMGIVNTISSAISGIKERVSGVVSGIGIKLGLGGKQFGGDIPRTGSYLLHKGESVIPAGAGMGGGITVNILGGYYLSEMAAEDMGDKIVDKIKKIMKL